MRERRPLLRCGGVGLAADFPAVVWVPSTSVLGGKLVVGGILPFGQSWVKAQAVLTGPRGNAFSLSKGDTAFVLGFMVGKIPFTVRLHGTTESNVKNRLQGHSIWFDLSMPLHVHLPPGAPG